MRSSATRHCAPFFEIDETLVAAGRQNNRAGPDGAGRVIDVGETMVNDAFGPENASDAGHFPAVAAFPEERVLSTLLTGTNQCSSTGDRTRVVDMDLTPRSQVIPTLARPPVTCVMALVGPASFDTTGRHMPPSRCGPSCLVLLDMPLSMPMESSYTSGNPSEDSEMQAASTSAYDAARQGVGGYCPPEPLQPMRGLVTADAVKALVPRPLISCADTAQWTDNKEGMIARVARRCGFRYARAKSLIYGEARRIDAMNWSGSPLQPVRTLLYCRPRRQESMKPMRFCTSLAALRQVSLRYAAKRALA